MVWLTRFPLEVFDILSPMLRDRHFARLYMTGDSYLQYLLERIHSRKCRMIDVNWNEPSSLIQRFIVGMATNVETELSHLPITTLAKRPSRLTRLTIDTYRSDAPFRGADFSTLNTLEYLKIGEGYALDGRLKLPESITCLDIGDILTSNPVPNLKSLRWLRELTIGKFNSCICDRRRNTGRFFDSLSQLESLTVLRVPGDDCVDLFQSLPPLKLTELIFTHTRNGSQFDLAAVVEKQKMLKTLGVVNVDVTIGGPLPPTLTTLMLDVLQITNGSTVLETFRSLPQSLSNFTFNSLYGPSADGMTEDEDAEQAFFHICPQLTLDSLEYMTGVISRILESPSREFDSVLSTTAIERGLDDNYLLLCDVPTYRRMISRGDMALLLESAESEEIALDAIKMRQRNSTELFYGDPDELVLPPYDSKCIRLLELGLTNVLDLSSTMPMDDALSAEAINNLVVIRVHPSAIRMLRHLVSTNKLACLKRVEVDYAVSAEQVLDVLHYFRCNLPRLDEVILHRYHDTLALEDELLDKLATDMRLFLLSDEARFFYSVEAESAYRRARNPRRVAKRVMSTVFIAGCFAYVMFAAAVLLAAKINGY